MNARRYRVCSYPHNAAPVGSPHAESEHCLGRRPATEHELEEYGVLEYARSLDHEGGGDAEA